MLVWLGGLVLAASIVAPGCGGTSVDRLPYTDGDGDGDGEPDADEVVVPEAGAVTDLTPCDAVTGGGCGEGEICATALVGSGSVATRCGPAAEAGTASPGGPCRFTTEDGTTAIHDCPVGHTCVVASSGGVARCWRLCTDEDPGICTGVYAGVEGVLADGLCTFALGGSAELEGVRLCEPVHDCDPRCNDCPSPYDTCYFTSDELRSGWVCYATIFADVGAGEAGDPCSYVNNCRGGLTCVTVAEGSRECRPYCDSRDETTLDPACPRVACPPGAGSCVPVEDARLRLLRPGLGVCLGE